MSHPSDFEDEVEVILLMFDDQILRGTDESNATFLDWNITTRIHIRIRIPRFGYPTQDRPTVQVLEAPNVSYQIPLQLCLERRIAEEIELGMPALAQIISIAKEESEAVESNFEREINLRNEKINEEQEELHAILEQTLEGKASRSGIVTSSGIFLLRGEIISDRKSKFLAHVAKVSSVEQVNQVVFELRRNKWIATACHPSIYAYRFIDEGGLISQDCDDDGESGGGKRILFLMEKCNVVGYIVIVTRWFGGILLGSDRFKHIMECAKQTLVKHHII